MKVLVTGGAGFIGSHLCEHLLEQGHEVTIIDDLSTGSADNIKHLKESPKFSPFFESIMNTDLLSELISQCDMIYHLAAAVGVKKVISSPVETIERNVKGTEYVLKYANLSKKKVLLTSTSEVYGKGNLPSFKETDDLTIGPTYIGRWSYACSKAIDEFLALAYWKEYKLPVTIVRLFNIVGPRQSSRYGMVIPRFVRQALNNEPVTVFGSGNQTRCFLYVKDAVHTIAQLAIDKKSVGEIFNLGNPSPITINDLAKMIIQMTKSSSQIKHIPYEECYNGDFEDMLKRVPNIDKIKKQTNFTPTLELPEIIETIIRDRLKKHSHLKSAHAPIKAFRSSV